MRKFRFCLLAAVATVVLASPGVLLARQCPEVLAPADWEWYPARTAPVPGGYGQAVVGAGDHLYLLRFLYASSPPEFYRYDPGTNSWAAASTAGLHPGVFRPGTALTWDGDNAIYALAGARHDDADRRQFWRYSIGTGIWERMPDTPYAQGAGNAIAWSVYDDQVYAFVGSGSPHHNNGRSRFVRFDPTPGKEYWTVLFPCLCGKTSGLPAWTVTDEGASLASAGEYLYALQGRVVNLEPTENCGFARFHIPSLTWEPLAEIPDPGGVGAGGSLLWVGELCPELGDHLFALGGGAANGLPGDGFYMYTISEGGWTSLADLPSSVGFFVGPRLAFAGGDIYYWQGERTGQPTGGKGFYHLAEAGRPDVDPCVACLAIINELHASEFQWVPSIGVTLGPWPWGYGGSLWFPDPPGPRRLADRQPYEVSDTCSLAQIREALEAVPYVGRGRSEAILRYFCPELWD